MRGGSGPQLQQSESRTMRGGSGPHLQQSESRTMREQWSAEELALVGVVDVIVVRSTNFVLGPHHFINISFEFVVSFPIFNHCTPVLGRP